jgi:hypothetical protein
MLKVTSGERPLRPVGVLYDDRGLIDLMWRLMEDCWEHVPTRRPTASQIIMRLPPQTPDKRPCGDWGDLSSRFRTLDSEKSLERQDLSVVETLRVLETIGISLFRL